MPHILHTTAKIGIDDFESLRGLFTKAKGGFYHGGRFAEMAALVDHYNDFMSLSLTTKEKK